MPIIVEFINLQHHSIIISNSNFSVLERFKINLTIDAHLFQFIQRDKLLLAWLRLSPGILCIQILKDWHICFESIVTIPVPISLLSPFLSMEQSKEFLYIINKLLSSFWMGLADLGLEVFINSDSNQNLHELIPNKSSIWVKRSFKSHCICSIKQDINLRES